MGIGLQIRGGTIAATLSGCRGNAVAATANLAGGTTVPAGSTIVCVRLQIGPRAIAAAESGLRTLADSVAAGLSQGANMPAGAAIAVIDEQVRPCSLATTVSRRHSCANSVAADLARPAGDSTCAAVAGVAKKVNTCLAATRKALLALAHAADTGLVRPAGLVAAAAVVGVGSGICAFTVTALVMVSRDAFDSAVPAIQKGLGRDTRAILTALATGASNSTRAAVIDIILQVDARTASGGLVRIAAGISRAADLIASAAIRFFTQTCARTVAAILTKETSNVALATISRAQRSIDTSTMAIGERRRADAIARVRIVHKRRRTGIGADAAAGRWVLHLGCRAGYGDAQASASSTVEPSARRASVPHAIAQAGHLSWIATHLQRRISDVYVGHTGFTGGAAILALAIQGCGMKIRLTLAQAVATLIVAAVTGGIGYGAAF